MHAYDGKKRGEAQLKISGQIFSDLGLRRMIGGRTANESQWTFTASLSFLQPDAPFQICTGTLISKDWILTAAHCVDDIKYQPEHLLVNIRQPGDKIKTKNVFGVSKIVVHRMFMLKYKFLPPGKFSWDFDIALIKLNVSVPENMSVARLPTDGMHATNCKSAGWGSKSVLQEYSDSKLKNYEVSETLQEIDVPIIPFYKCHDYFTKDHKTFARFNFKVFCGGSLHNETTPGIGGCIGDSGSPLICGNSNEDESITFGIMLGGHPLCKTGKNYMIFTNVSSHVNWIKRQIK
eukprot:gene46-640_t